MKRFISSVLACAALLSAAACSSNTADQTKVKETENTPVDFSVEQKSSPNYQKIVEAIADQYEFGGVIAVSKNGETQAQYAYFSSDADTEFSEVYNGDTLFCLGTASTQFTSAAVMMLQEQGKLNVDDSLSLYFPEYVIGQDITVKNLLTMRSGIVDYFSEESDSGDDDYYYEEDEEDVLPYTIYAEADSFDNKNAITQWLFNQPLDFEPDRGYEYSNSNYLLLSCIVEQVTGVDYETFVKENIFAPLGMDGTGFISDMIDSKSLAKSEEKLPEAAACAGASAGAFDIVSCADDMDKWLTALHECTLISRDSRDKMTANYSPENTESGYGYGFMITSGKIPMNIGTLGSYTVITCADEKSGTNVFAATSRGFADEEQADEFKQKLIDKTTGD